jgi:hypothetical protein
MAIEYYKGFDTYVIYGEESVYGTPVAPGTTNFPGRIQSFNLNMSNNSFRSQGLGDGRNATGIYLGPLDVSGSMDFQLSDPTFLQYAIGTVTGAGSVASPYQIEEAENIGFDAANIPSLTLEVGSEGDTSDDEITISGVVLNNLTITATQGEIITCSADWVAQTVLASTTLQVVAAQSDVPFMFHDATCTVGSDTLQCTSFSVTISNNITPYRELGSRLITQPSAGLRRYDFTITLRKKVDTTASTLSGLELRGLFLGAATTTLAPSADNQNASNTVSLDINEGIGAAPDRVLNIDLASASFDSWSEPITLDGGVIEVTVTGMALAGLADGAVNVPIRWYAIA